MPKKIIQPYKHDCEMCRWVSWVVMGESLGNMYLCVKGRLTEIIIRWSSDPPDYACYSILEDSNTKPSPIEIIGDNNEK